MAVFVDICMITFPDDTSIFLCERRFIYERAFDQICDILKRVHIFIDFFKDRSLKFLKDLADIRDHCQ